MSRMHVHILGRTLGTAESWDGDPDVMWFEDFQPSEGIELPAGWLQVDLAKGLIGAQNEDTGEIDEPKDLVVFLAKLPRNN